MPVKKCDNGKYRIGEGECMYTSKSNAERAYRAYLAKKNENNPNMKHGIQSKLRDYYPGYGVNNGRSK